MNRRQFLQTISLIPLSSYIKQSIASTRAVPIKETPLQRVYLDSVPVAGFQFYKGKNLWDKLNIKDTLTLTREPNNKYDENAIAIIWKNQQLGYIPKIDNQPYAIKMDDGEKVYAEITTLTKSSNPWKRIDVDLYQLVDEKDIEFAFYD